MATKKKSKAKAKLSYRAFLWAFDSQGEEVESVELSTHDYYDESHDLIDNARYRSDNGVRSLRGELYGPRGKLFQKFEGKYSAKGKLVYNRTEHEDGTVHEHTFDPDRESK